MDVEKLAQSVNISVRKTRALIKEMRRLGYLPPDDKLEEVKKIKMYMNHKQGLSVEQFVALIENPDLLKALGAKAIDVRREIAFLGDVKGCKLPDMAFAVIHAASKGDLNATQRLMNWTKENMPDHECRYQHFAVRLLIGMPEDRRTAVARRLHRAYLAVKQLPEFDGWFHIVEVHGKNRTIFHKPKNTR